MENFFLILGSPFYLIGLFVCLFVLKRKPVPASIGFFSFLLLLLTLIASVLLERMESSNPGIRQIRGFVLLLHLLGFVSLFASFVLSLLMTGQSVVQRDSSSTGISKFEADWNKRLIAVSIGMILAYSSQVVCLIAYFDPLINLTEGLVLGTILIHVAALTCYYEADRFLRGPARAIGTVLFVIFFPFGFLLGLISLIIDARKKVREYGRPF